jgi:hypothetical protein
VRPSNDKYDPAKGPLLSNVGQENIIAPVDVSFAVGAGGAPSIADVRYYYYPVQSFQYDPSGLAQSQVR